MAIATGTFTTFTAIGNREDLADIIYNISPEETPFMNNIGRSTCDATLFEWQTDSLSAAAANAQLQGDDLTTYDSVTVTVRVGNRTQISRKSAVVSGTQERVDKAGRKSEMNYQIAKKSSELKRDIEFVLLNPQGGVTGSAAVAPTTASMQAWIKTNVNMGATGVNPNWTSGVPAAANVRTDGTPRSFTEIILKSVLAQCFTSGANPTILMVGPTQKGVVSGFAGIATRFRDVNSRQTAQIIGAADVYVGDFSTVNVVPNRFQRDRDAWVLDPKMASVAYLRTFQKKALATTGDAEKVMLLAEYGLKVNNEAAHGLAADLG